MKPISCQHIKESYYEMRELKYCTFSKIGQNIAVVAFTENWWFYRKAT